eukprot:3324643-Pleurochrysis_carterae.AAC.2
MKTNENLLGHPPARKGHDGGPTPGPPGAATVGMGVDEPLFLCGSARVISYKRLVVRVDDSLYGRVQTAQYSVIMP